MDITINLFWVIVVCIVFMLTAVTLFLLHNLGGLNIFSKHDNKLVGQFVDKTLLSKNPKELAIDNNHEIQDLKEEVDKLKLQFNDMNDKLKFILEELQKRG